MKTFILILLFGVIAVSAQEKNAFTYFDEKSGKDCLIGECDRTAFYDTLFASWFDEEYENYVIDIEEISNFKKEIFSTEILIIMATWCSDSRRELPRFFKILDYISYPPDNVKIVAVNRDKKGIDTETDNLNIKFVPTFILYKAGKEIGRIIETPSISLEKDLTSILLNNED
ncbi:MAG TPA: thioredoxin family protein [Melioribacteraceae bacterium]|nr:thioredoxin family protein [Melioribacteraceae bacterium]